MGGNFTAVVAQELKACGEPQPAVAAFNVSGHGLVVRDPIDDHLRLTSFL